MSRLDSEPQEGQVRCKQDLKIVNADTLLPIQTIPVKGRGDLVNTSVFWDKGSTTVLIRRLFAEQLKLSGCPCTQYIQVAGHGYEKWQTVAYHLFLVDREGQLHKILAYSVETITSDIERIKLDGIEHHFSGTGATKWDLDRASGPVDLFIGVNFTCLHPVEFPEPQLVLEGKH